MSGKSRINFLIILVFILGGVTIYRLFNLTYFRYPELTGAARNQYNNPTGTLAGRGNIYFGGQSAEGRRLAVTNKPLLYVYSNNREIYNTSKIVPELASILDMEEGEIADLLSEKNKTHQVIAKNLTKEQAAKVQALKISGLRIASTVDRIYNFDIASVILGFVGFDGNRRVGQYGVEAYYDETLSGARKNQEWFDGMPYPFNFFSKSNGVGSRLANLLKFNNGEPESDKQVGKDIVLSINFEIQSFVEIILAELLDKWDAESGMIIIQEPASGKIVAMAAKPTFDSNNYSDYELDDFINPAVQKVFEPGSSFKPITMAAAVDSGAVTPETTYTDQGLVQIGGYTIKNFDDSAHGVQSMRGVLQKSLNTGAIFAQQRTGDDAFLNYVVAFGFGQKSGIDLPGEVSGNISNLYSGRKVNFATASFGQGIAVTPIQLINAYSAIANGGKLMRPYVVEKIINPDGSMVETQPRIIGSPISGKSSVLMKSMLVDVVEKGFDKARIKGYDIAGKTGTAQIPDEKGGYLEGQFIHNFVGFAPAYSPRFTILIRMDKPKGIKFAADSLSPVFGEIARYLIRYFNIPPTK